MTDAAAFKAMSKHPQDEQISAYLDGMLSVGETRQVSSHLAECDSCRAVLHSLRDVKQMLHEAAPPPALPDAFWADTLRRMRVEERSDTVPRRPSWSWRSPRLALGAGAAALALAALLVHPSGNPQLPVVPVVAPQDSLDTADFAQFMRQHTESAAAQPLADNDRQRMMSAEIASSQVADRDTSESNADPSL